jgi:hypothetical protein
MLAGPRRLRALLSAVTLSAIVAAGVGSCGVADKVKNVASTVENNKDTIESFTTPMKASETIPFEATYVTSGAHPATIVYAVQPPKELLFKENSTGGSNGKSATDLIVNSSGEYSCQHSTGSGKGAKPGWSCSKLGTAQAAVQQQLLGIYTPGHWVNFLRGLALAAGFAGDKVSRSTMSAHGFALQCVDFQAAGIPGTSKICTTSKGILGYVKVASEPTTFELKSYTGSPAASLFRLPAGAKITTT